MDFWIKKSRKTSNNSKEFSLYSFEEKTQVNSNKKITFYEVFGGKRNKKKIRRGNYLFSLFNKFFKVKKTLKKNKILLSTPEANLEWKIMKIKKKSKVLSNLFF